MKAFRLFYLVPMLPSQVGYFYRCGMDLLPMVLRLPVLVHALNLTEKRQTRIVAEFQCCKVIKSQYPRFYLQSAVWSSLLLCRELNSPNLSKYQMYISLDKTCHFVQIDFFPPGHTGQHLNLLL